MIDSHITQLLGQAKLGDKQVLDEVYRLLYAEIKSIAGYQLQQLRPGETITPTVLAHECYLKISQTQEISTENRRHFLNYLSTSMRRFLIDKLRAQKRLKRNQQQANVGITEFVGDEDVEFQLMDIDLMLNHVATIDTELAELLQYKLVMNFTFSQIAAVVNLSERQVMRRWKQGRVLLLSMLKEHQRER